MIANCTVIAGYTTYPHVDMYDAGQRAGNILINSLKGRVNPTMACAKRPMLPHTLRMGTDDAPMGNLVARAKTIEGKEALAVTVFGGFPLADFYDAGLSVVAVTDSNQKLAEDICENLAQEAWQRRNEFVYTAGPLNESVASAGKLTEGPILLIDHADNCASGGTQDTMAVVAEVLRQGLNDVAVGAIRDPEAVQKMVLAGVGSRLTLQLGGKMDMPSIGRKGEPLEVTGIVKVISDGEFVVQGPMYTGVKMSMGKTAVLDTGSLQFVVIENNHEPFSTIPGCIENIFIRTGQPSLKFVTTSLRALLIVFPIATKKRRENLSFLLKNLPNKNRLILDSYFIPVHQRPLVVHFYVSSRKDCSDSECCKALT
jgi:microcystin degradation protein MlrC